MQTNSGGKEGFRINGEERREFCSVVWGGFQKRAVGALHWKGKLVNKNKNLRRSHWQKTGESRRKREGGPLDIARKGFLRGKKILEAKSEA